MRAVLHKAIGPHRLTRRVETMKQIAIREVAAEYSLSVLCPVRVVVVQSWDGKCLVLLTLLLALALHGLGADLLVVLLESSKVLATLGELTLLHTLTDVPVNECALGVHQIELVVHASEHLGHGGGVGDHEARALHLGEVTTRDHGRWLVVDAALEASRAPVDELDGALGLDGSDSSVHVPH